jgi:succinyl-diaminopimelate desuccinylase
MADPDVDADLALDLARRLVQTPSVNPLGDPLHLGSCNEGAVAGIVLAEILRMGVPARRVLVAKRRPMVLAEWGQGPGPTLMINSHLDTVGVEGMLEPFSGEVRDGSLFGRGSADTKAGVAAAVAAFAAVVRSRPQPTHGPKVLLALVPDEEHEGLGSQYLRDHGPHANAAVVVEPTGLRLGIGQAGGVKFRIRTHGRATHACVHTEGVNAILHMAGLLPRLVEAATAPTHPLLGHAPFCIGTIHGGSDPSIVADECCVEADRRILPGETWPEIRTALESVLDEQRARDATLDVELEEPFLGPVDGFVLPGEHPLVQAMQNAYTGALGREPVLYVTPYAADGMYLAQAGIPALTFGPGDIAQAHSHDESVPVDELLAAAEVLARLMADWLDEADA